MIIFAGMFFFSTLINVSEIGYVLDMKKEEFDTSEEYEVEK